MSGNKNSKPFSSFEETVNFYKERQYLIDGIFPRRFDDVKKHLYFVEGDIRRKIENDSLKLKDVKKIHDLSSTMETIVNSLIFIPLTPEEELVLEAITLTVSNWLTVATETPELREMSNRLNLSNTLKRANQLLQHKQSLRDASESMKILLRETRRLVHNRDSNFEISEMYLKSFEQYLEDHPQTTDYSFREMKDNKQEG